MVSASLSAGDISALMLLGDERGMGPAKIGINSDMGPALFNT